MNIWIICILCALATVGIGFLLAKLVMVLWFFACPPVTPAPRSPLPQDRTTAAAAMMTSAAFDIEQRLYEAAAIGCLLEDEELLQLVQAQLRLNAAFDMLKRYETRYAEDDRRAATQRSTTPTLQHFNS